MTFIRGRFQDQISNGQNDFTIHISNSSLWSQKLTNFPMKNQKMNYRVKNYCQIKHVYSIKKNNLYDPTH